jgi:hypothetical protein
MAGVVETVGNLKNILILSLNCQFQTPLNPMKSYQCTSFWRHFQNTPLNIMKFCFNTLSHPAQPRTIFSIVFLLAPTFIDSDRKSTRLSPSRSLAMTAKKNLHIALLKKERERENERASKRESLISEFLIKEWNFISNTGPRTRTCW